MDVKLKIIVGIGLIMFGIIEAVVLCNGGIKDNKEEQSQQQQITNINTSNISTLRVKTFNYNNHKYIKFTSGKEAGYVHDPDCPCQNKNKK